MKDEIKGLYIRIPKSEYKRFKIFAANADMSMQMLVRNSVRYFIQEFSDAKKRTPSKEE